MASGGFANVYRGLGPVAIGSGPGASLFFVTYETSKAKLKSVKGIPDSIKHIMAASISEGEKNPSKQAFQASKLATLTPIKNDKWNYSTPLSKHTQPDPTLPAVAACLVRVPTEVLKTRQQTSSTSLLSALKSTLADGGAGNLYRGFGITLFREVPFACLQFPVYEGLKSKYGDTPLRSAACGSLSGALAAGLTTPLDVVKTRYQIGYSASNVKYESSAHVVRLLVEEEGARAFMKGVEPRVMWIGIGGFVFFGAYEGAKTLLRDRV